MDPIPQRPVAVVTGGESGIGRATARQLAGAGYAVFVGDVTPRPENDAVYPALGISRHHCDVRQESDVVALIAAAVAGGGRLDVLVNNAGIGMVKPITDVTVEEWDRCLDINLKGAFLGCKHAIPAMRTTGGGSIINVASNAGILPRAHDPVYSISKLALVGLTKSLALCHGPDRIRVNAVCPGPVEETGMMDADLDAAPDRQAFYQARVDAAPIARACGRMITPDEIAASILYLASPAALMVTGTLIAIDGGKSLGVPPEPVG